MVTSNQLFHLKKVLIEQKINLVQGNNMLQGNLREATDELSTIDNHPAELATELFEREKDLALKVHNEDLLAKVNAALEQMKQNTYGVCQTCNTSIQFERLLAVPYTAFCVDHSKETTVPTDRPIEEDLIPPPTDNSFANREANDFLQDDEDSFRVVAQYGSSDTPSDFEGDYDDYNDLYSPENSSYAELDVLHLSTETLGGQISQAYAKDAAKQDYVE